MRTHALGRLGAIEVRLGCDSVVVGSGRCADNFYSCVKSQVFKALLKESREGAAFNVSGRLFQSMAVALKKLFPPQVAFLNGGDNQVPSRA